MDWPEPLERPPLIRLPQAIVAVITCTLSAGAAGSVVGATVGRFAPSFVSWIYNPTGLGPNAGVDPVEFGLGLGVVSGLFLGVGTGVFLVTVLALRDAWLARAGVVAYSKSPADDIS